MKQSGLKVMSIIGVVVVSIVVVAIIGLLRPMFSSTATRIQPTATFTPLSAGHSSRPSVSGESSNWCSPAEADQFAAVPGATSGLNWAVVEEYQFPLSSWAPGEHEYIFWFSPCRYLGDLPESLTRSFRVATDSTPFDGWVYLGPLGLTYSSDPYGQTLMTIHPTQPTKARLRGIHLTQAEAWAVTQECQAWISWDGGEKQQLIMRQPCAYEIH